MSVSSNRETLQRPLIAGGVLLGAISLWRRLEPVFQRTIAVALFLLFWETAPRLGLISRSFVPPFTEVVSKTVEFYLAGKLMPHVFASLGRSFGGFAVSVAVGVPLGMLLGWFEPIERYLDPLLQLFRQVNAFAMYPIFILLFGLGYVTKVAIIVWVVFWPIFMNTVAGVKYVDPVLVKCAKSLGISKRAFFAKIVIPSAIPSVITGLRIGATYSLLMLVGAEMVGGESGLGYLIMNAQYLLSVHLTYAGIIVIALLGLGTNYALVKLEKRLTAWKEVVPT